MAILYSNSSGGIIRFIANTSDEYQHQVPQGAVYVLKFDEGSNPTLITGLLSDINNYLLLGNNLTYQGNAVNLSSPGQVYLDQQTYNNLITILKNFVQNQNPTVADAVTALKAMIRLFAQIYR